MIKNSLIFSDLHCANYKPFSKILLGGINSRFQVTMDVLSEIYNYARNNKIENIFFLGDLFHIRGRIDTIIYDTVYKFLKENNTIHTFLLAGNHDQAKKDGKITAIAPLSELQNVTVIEETTKIENILFIPYQEQFDLTLLEDANYLMLHQGISNAIIGASNYIIGEILKAKHLTKYKKVFAGHYHPYQILEDFIYLPGSPLQHTFGERKDKKGFLHVDEDRNVNFIETSAPKFKQLEIESEKDIQGISEGDYVKFIIKSKRAKKINFQQYSDNFKVELDLPKRFEERLEIGTEDDDITILKKYLVKFKDSIVDKGLSLEKMKTMGERIWENYEQQ